MLNPVTLNGFSLFGCSTGVNKARSGRLQNHLGVESESVVSVNGLGRFDLVDAANKEKLTMLEYLKKKKCIDCNVSERVAGPRQPPSKN